MPAIDLGSYQETLSRVLLAPAFSEHDMLCRAISPPQEQEELAKDPLKYAEQRLAVYRNNVIHSLTEAMAAQFPAVKKLVGDDFFLALARDYVRAQPPLDPALTFYGETFPAFIAGHEHCVALPYLPDVATLEWLCQTVLHAADEPVLTPQELAGIDPDLLGDVRFRMHRAAALFASSFPAVEIREQALKDDPDSLDLDELPASRALILRRDFNVSVIHLNPSAYLLLDALRRGHTIGTGWEIVAGTYSLNDEAFPALLAHLLGLGVWSDYEIRQEE